MSELQKEVQALLNRHSRENESDTPDYILARYLMGCLTAFEAAVKAREVWYGRGPKASLRGVTNKDLADKYERDGYIDIAADMDGDELKQVIEALKNSEP